MSGALPVSASEGLAASPVDTSSVPSVPNSNDPGPCNAEMDGMPVNLVAPISILRDATSTV